jgi:hypothetical protein
LRSAAASDHVDAVADAAFGGDDQPTEWVTVYWAGGLEEAHVVQGHLEQEDIPSILPNESGGALGSGALTGVWVQVPRTLEDRAREILNG